VPASLNFFLTLQILPVCIQAFHENDLKLWYRLLLRSSGLFALGLHERIAMTLLELMWGLRNRRRARQGVFRPGQRQPGWCFAAESHRASGQFEREHCLLRQPRQLVVCDDKLNESMSIHPRNERNMDRLLICHSNGLSTTLTLEEEGELILCDEEEGCRSESWR
jgi:hypothetical protein